MTVLDWLADYLALVMFGSMFFFIISTRDSIVVYFRVGKMNPIVTNREVSMPISSWYRFTKLRIMNPAPAKRTSVSVS